LLSKAVDGNVTLTASAQVSAQDEGAEATSVNTIGIDVTNVELDSGVVLGSDQTVGVRAVSSTSSTTAAVAFQLKDQLLVKASRIA
jgi:hypothetical protein